VPLNECGESVFVPSFDEAVQKLSIGLVGQTVKKSDDRGKAIGHQSLSRGYLILPEKNRGLRSF
jgi:hypothetical protein